MITGIGTNNYSMYQQVSQDSQNQINNTDKGTDTQRQLAIYIFKDYANLDTSSDDLPRTFEEYVDNKKASILSDTVEVNAREACKLTIEEYESRKKDYYNKINEFNFEQGFQDYMKELGCNNEEELSQYLPEKDRNDVISEAKKYLSWVSVSNPTVIPLLRDIDNYAQNIDFDTWKQFQNDLYSIDATGKPMTSLEVEGKAVKNLLNSLGIENSDLNSKSIDLFVLQNKCAYLKGESIDTDKLMEDFSEKSQIYLSNGGTWENFLEQYLNDSIEAVTKELEELTLLSEQTREQEQVNLTESFISTKIAQYKK